MARRGFCNLLMKSSALFIDGENFKYKIGEILESKTNFPDFDIHKLFDTVLPDEDLKERNYYVSKLHFHKETAKKSTRLIEEQRKLKRNLISSGFNFVVSGHVRIQEVTARKPGQKKFVFYEKGVDVRIAVDLVSYAYDKRVNRVYLCSSDSDLQPAIHKAREKGLKVIYVGFESSPNIGLTKTTDSFILVKNSQILECAETILNSA